MQSIKKNTLYLMFSQIVGYVFPLLTLPYLSHVFTPAQFGVMGVCQAITQYFIIVTDYGFNITATREVSVWRNDKKRISEIFCNTLAAKLFLLLVCVGGMIGVVLFLDIVKGYETLLFCCFLGVIGNAMFPLWLFQGTELMKVPVFFVSLAKMLLLAAVFVLVKDENDLNVAALLLNGGNFLAGVFAIVYIAKKSLASLMAPKAKDIVLTMKEGWPVFLSTVAISFYTTFNTVLLSYHTTASDIGYYNAADKIRIAIQSLFGPVTQALYPRIAHAAVNNKSYAISLIKKGTVLLLAITVPCAVILLFFSDILVKYYLSDSYNGAIPYLQYLSFLPVVIAVATAYCNWGLLGFGEGKLVSKIYVTFGLLHMLYAIPLILHYKVTGVIVSVYTTQTLITIVTVYFYNKIRKSERAVNGS
ncbi:flippase [Erwinia sp. S38]|uniref:flippase n=1 Tax=Erwinia sp. S38 TaxID=2769338 RepID=UPI00190BE90A|nr:flippase [Erwinia sp. S38]MBK0002133.1 flippase [Erwinia sp. S38]